MHHAFPNECPQPRALGATEAPMTHAEWRANQKTSTVVTKKVAQHLAIMADLTEDAAGGEQNSMLWTEEEELVTSLDVKRLGSPWAEESTFWRTLRVIAMCGAAVSTIAVLFDSLRSSAFLWRTQGAKEACSRAGDLPRWEASTG